MATRVQLFNCRYNGLVQLYEGTLREKHGWNVKAMRTRNTLKLTFGMGRVACTAHFVMLGLHEGLKKLVANGLPLEWSDSSLVLEFPDLFTDEVIEQAKRNLELARKYAR
jgi:hypothetical protein